ncbi:hypothetical protein C5167_040273 [Papaver somniferum]|uniref:Uncharacterized protein n=1 Tax=Papaver somniferum TaxID=3469 RepID=A0A4Y7IIP3_PAPSO|nr:hypothetical protein C5167_040273 [Papaver somniferum]
MAIFLLNTTLDEKSLFYYFVVSERNPNEDPVVLWLNGGPACSSFDGFVYEHGPFNFEKPKTCGSLPKLQLNPYSWSNVLNITYLDSPAGVGLSYKTGDLRTSLETHTFLLKWFEQYPEFLANPFYISGESCSGIYVPTLASEVVKGLEAGVKPVLNFKGHIIGNGVTDGEFDGNSFVPFAHGQELEVSNSSEGIKGTRNDDEVANAWLNNEAENLIWEICTDKILYNHDLGSMIKYHRNLTAWGYRALIFSGDHDMCVPYIGSEKWTRSLGYKIIDECLSFAMYLQGYDNNLTFLTIKSLDFKFESIDSILLLRGAGHTVPRVQAKGSIGLL